MQVEALLFTFAVPVQKIFLKVPFRSTLHPADLEIDVEFDGSFSHCTTLYEGDKVLHVYVFIISLLTAVQSVMDTMDFYHHVLLQ